MSREQELLAALGREAPGIEMHMGRRQGTDFASIVTLYEPNIRAVGTTLFEAAFNVAKQLMQHPDIPASVFIALNKYDQHTGHLLL